MTVTVSTWKGHAINDGTNYSSYMRTEHFAAPTAQAQMVLRSGRGPLFGAMVRPGTIIMVETFIEGGSAPALRAQLRQWFDVYDSEGQLVINGDEGEDQYITAVCEAHYPDDGGAGLSFVSVLRVVGDEAWRKTTATTPSNWSVTASGQTRNYSNAGEKDAYPVVSFTPTSAKSGANPYKQFWAVRWVGAEATAYPVDIVNASLDTRVSPTTNFASATGDDIRVYVDGALTDFWLSGINTANTKVWVNLNFKKGVTGVKVASAISTGSLETIDADADISGYADSGILQIDNELFVYSSKNNALKRFFIESRAAKGSSEATHSVGATIGWVQHDIVITYGSGSLSAYASDDNYKPIFNLASSTNTSWVYAEFGEDDGLRTGAWKKGLEYSDWVFNYTANHGTDADPWSEIGIYRSRVDIFINAYFYVYNPCGITNVNFTNGERYAGSGYLQNKAYIKSGINGPNEYSEYQLPSMTADATWQSWSRSEALRSGSKYAGIYLDYTPSGAGVDMYMEASDCTLTLTNTPGFTGFAEQGNYNLDCTLTDDDGDAIQVTFQMETGETLTIDTDNATAIYEKDGSTQYGAVTRLGGPRLTWLKLKPGTNTWQFDDVGTAGLTIAVSYEERRGA